VEKPKTSPVKGDGGGAHVTGLTAGMVVLAIALVALIAVFVFVLVRR